MAQMSKTLATIEVHVPIEFDMEAAKLTDLYTPEAYVYMKRLEFKNMLTRFSDDMSQNDLEKYFHVYHELDEIQNFLMDFPQKRRQCLSLKRQELCMVWQWQKQSERCLSDLRRICDRRISGRTGPETL